METTTEKPPSSIHPYLPTQKSSDTVIYFHLGVGESKEHNEEEIRVSLLMNDVGEYSIIWCRRNPENPTKWQEISRYLRFRTEAQVEAEWSKFLLNPSLYLGIL